MPRADGAERRLFRDLSGLLSDLRTCPLADVEQAIEARFRRYLATGHRSPSDTLSVTLSWQLPEGAESWALYATEFQIEARGRNAAMPAPAPAGHAAGNVIAFPACTATGRRR